MTKQQPAEPGGIDIRTAVILIASCMMAIITGLLTFVTVHLWAPAVLAGGASIAGSALFLDWLLKHNE